MNIKSVLLASAIALAMTASAHANLILVEPGGTTPAPSVAASFTDLGATGFGHAPRLLTMQMNGVENGSVTPVNVTVGDAIAGADKSTTPTLSTLGWSSGANVGIGFNADQTGGTGITMQQLTLTIYNGTTAVGSFSLASSGQGVSDAPIQFSAGDLAMQQGNGNAVFNFGLTAAEQAQFNNILALSGSSGFFAGLQSELGCPAGTPPPCLPSNDGPDSFLGFNQHAAVPAPLVGHGFLALLAIGGVLFGSKFLENRKTRLNAA